MLLFASSFLRDPRIVSTFAIATLALTIGLYRRGLRRGQRQPFAALVAGAALGLIVAFTWPITSGDLAELSPARWSLVALRERLDPANGGFGAWTHGTDDPLNVLLHVPAGLAVTTLVPHRHALRQPPSLSPCCPS